jgi:NAD+ diphosphatase
MFGAFGEALEGEDKIRLDLDNELEDARWFTRDEVLAVLGDSASSTLSKSDLEKMDENERVRAEEERKKKQQQEQAGEKKWNEKDEGSVANVNSDSDAAKKAFR